MRPPTPPCCICGYDLTGTPTDEGTVTCPECGEHQIAGRPRLPRRNLACVSLAVTVTMAPALLASAFVAWHGGWGAAAALVGLYALLSGYIAMAASLAVRVLMRWFGVRIASEAGDDAAAAAWWSMGLGIALACLYALFASVV